MSDLERYRDRLLAAQRELEPLVGQAEAARAALPEIARMVERRNRAAGKLTKPRVARRARIVHDGLNQQIGSYYERFGTLCARIREALAALSDVLPAHEVESWVAQADPRSVGATCTAVRQASARLREFARSLPGAEPLPYADGGRRDVRTRRKYGPAPDEGKHRRIAQIVSQRDDAWRRTGDGLQALAAELDRLAIAGSRAWKHWHPTPNTWVQAAQLHPDRVIKSIDYSLEKAGESAV